MIKAVLGAAVIVTAAPFVFACLLLIAASEVRNP